jgi:hypothetical protein
LAGVYGFLAETERKDPPLAFGIEGLTVRSAEDAVEMLVYVLTNTDLIRSKSPALGYEDPRLDFIERVKNTSFEGFAEGDWRKQALEAIARAAVVPGWDEGQKRLSLKVG